MWTFQESKWLQFWFALLNSTVHYWSATVKHFVQQQVVHSMSSLPWMDNITLYLRVTSSKKSLSKSHIVSITLRCSFSLVHRKRNRKGLTWVISGGEKVGLLLTDILCPSPAVPSCSVNEYVCASGGCVSASLRCDGHDNCLDGSDEVSIVSDNSKKQW